MLLHDEQAALGKRKEVGLKSSAIKLTVWSSLGVLYRMHAENVSSSLAGIFRRP